MAKIRESQFELLRIIAQWMIVFYHLLFFFTETIQADYPIFKGLQIPFHIGVILFVLISGYYGIRPSAKGLIKLLSMVAIYYVPVALGSHIGSEKIVIGGGNSLISNVLFISHSPYWYIRTYIILYLFSPVINKYLHDISNKERLALICSLAFIAIWIGTTYGDTSLAEGKNIMNFILIYVIGDSIRTYKDKLDRVSPWILLMSFISINSILVMLYTCNPSSIIGKSIFYFSYPYCSPIIYINAIIVFILFSKLKFYSPCTNKIAEAVLAVYLIHSHPVILGSLIGPIAYRILDFTSSSPFSLIVSFIIFATIIYILCTLVHFILSPVWNSIHYLTSKIN